MTSKEKLILIIAIYSTAFEFVQAQQTVIFKVKKPDLEIPVDSVPSSRLGMFVFPDSDSLFIGKENKICIISDNKERIFEIKFDVNDVKITREDSCYSIQFENKRYFTDNPGYTKDTLIYRNFIIFIVDEVLPKEFTKKRVLTRTYLLDKPIAIYQEYRQGPYHKSHIGE